MCKNMDELKIVSEKFFELSQKKKKKKNEINAIEKEINQLKNEISAYMKKRGKNELVVAGLLVLFTAFNKPSFDKDAFIAGEEDGEETYNKYTKQTHVERVTVKVAK